MKPHIKSKKAAESIVMPYLLAVAVLFPRGAAATDLTFGNPFVNGDGSPGTTAFFSNVGTQDGVSIDMLATVVDATPGKIAYFSAINGGDFRFDIGHNDGDRFFKVRYRFFESGTTNPRSIDDMSWSIGDLDKTSRRTESVVVKGTAGFLAETDTTLDIVQSAYTISAAGTVDLDQNDPDGNPEGVISFLFVDRAVLEITYQVAGGGGGYFDHAADGAFPFYSPQRTNMGIYYTFDIVNDEEVPVKMDFSNTLPGSLEWDTAFEPVLDGPLAAAFDPNAPKGATSLLEELNFSQRNQKVSFKEVPVPPGTSRFTLKTAPTSESGEFTNEAVVVPSAYSGFPQVEMVSYSTIVIPDAGPVPPDGPVGTLVETFKSNFCTFAWFAVDGTVSFVGSSTVVEGDVAIGPDATLGEKSTENIEGRVVRHNAEPPENSPVQADLSDETAAAIALAEDFAALPATHSIASISGDTMIDATAPDGVNVVSVGGINLSGKDKLTLRGNGDDWFIVNVANQLEVSGDAEIVLRGVNPNQVLLNVLPSVDEVKLTGNSNAFPVTLLIPSSDVFISGSTEYIGSVVAGGISQTLTGGAFVSGSSSFGGACE